MAFPQTVVDVLNNSTLAPNGIGSETRWARSSQAIPAVMFSSHNNKIFHDLPPAAEVFKPGNYSDCLDSNDEDDDISSQNDTNKYLNPSADRCSPYDEDRKRRRRDANRRAAKKCRQKKRDEQVRQETAYQNALKQNRELRADIDRYKHDLEKMRHLLAVHAATTTNGQCPLATTPPEAFFYASRPLLNTAAPELSPGQGNPEPNLYKMNAPSCQPVPPPMVFAVPSPAESASTATTSRPVSYASCSQSRRDSRDFAEAQLPSSYGSTNGNMPDLSMGAEIYVLPYAEQYPTEQPNNRYFTENCFPIGNNMLQQPYTTAVEASYHFAAGVLNYCPPAPAQSQNFEWMVQGADDPLLSESIRAVPRHSEEHHPTDAYADGRGELVEETGNGYGHVYH